MRKTALLFLLMATAMFLASGGAPNHLRMGKSQASSPRPNIILVMTDDLDERSMENFPGIRQMVGSNGRGATFENAFVTTSLCCPSRASLLTGMYAHNHLVRVNSAPKEAWIGSARRDTSGPTWCGVSTVAGIAPS
jgi:N-acetylglucosamine-6-sulfatase